jgi:hypothetical protein
VLYNLLRRYGDVIRTYQVRRFRRLQNAHELVMEMTLKDGSKLAIKDYMFLNGTRKYAYHWQDEGGNLLIRWDNSGRWKSLSTFPHHRHVRESTRVEDSDVRSMEHALEFISARLRSV